MPLCPLRVRAHLQLCTLINSCFSTFQVRVLTDIATECCDKIQTFSHFESFLARKLVFFNFSTKPRRAISVPDAHHLTNTIHTVAHLELELELEHSQLSRPASQPASSVLVVVILLVLYLSPLPAMARLRLSIRVREEHSQQ